MSTSDRITAAILQRLTDGVVLWHRPWTAGVPRHLLSRRPYRGINIWLTVSAGYASPDWLTVRQANTLGGRIQRGARGTPVVFWQWDEADDEDEPHPRRRPLMRTYIVFNLEQTTGIDAPGEPDPPACPPLARCDAVVAHMPQRPAIQHGAVRAAYIPRLDVIQMLSAAWFDMPEAYVSTLYHELTHSTGHPSRLHRATLTDACPFGSPTYSQEELVAEMGAAFLCGVCGIENRAVDKAYIASWLGVLKQETRMVILAAAQAQRAATRLGRGEHHVTAPMAAHHSRYRPGLSRLLGGPHADRGRASVHRLRRDAPAGHLPGVPESQGVRPVCLPDRRRTREEP
jgi:antirestriction protein ArdC